MWLYDPIPESSRLAVLPIMPASAIFFPRSCNWIPECARPTAFPNGVVRLHSQTGSSDCIPKRGRPTAFPNGVVRPHSRMSLSGCIPERSCTTAFWVVVQLPAVQPQNAVMELPSLSWSYWVPENVVMRPRSATWLCGRVPECGRATAFLSSSECTRPTVFQNHVMLFRDYIIPT